MLLGVNIDHIATLRNARGGDEPSVTEGAQACLRAGAHGITAHLREDRRHMKDADIVMLSDLGCRLNLEMAAVLEMQKTALNILPDACCIVPERRQEVTTEGGLDVYSNRKKMNSFVKPLLDAGILVSMFIDPEIKQIDASFETGAQYIELHTGAYSRAFGTDNEELEFIKLKSAAEYAQQLGLKVNAGHGLNYQNVCRMHEIGCLEELNIGHSIISRAVFTGLEAAVLQMINLIK